MSSSAEEQAGGVNYRISPHIPPEKANVAHPVKRMAQKPKKTVKRDKFVREPKRSVPQQGLRALIWKLLLKHLYQWFGWTWLIPRLSRRECNDRATNAQLESQFLRTKVVSVWVHKGGVGKSTIALLLALMAKIVKPSLATIAQDCDDGTLADRIERNCSLSIRDAVANLPYLDTSIDIQRYCSVTNDGVLVMASTRTHQLTGLTQVQNEDISGLINKEKGHFELIVNDLAPTTHSPTNLGALNATDLLVIPTTPAQDSFDKAKQSLSWLAENGYGHLAHNAILVVNRASRRTKIEKFRKELVDELGKNFMNVQVLSLNSSRHLSGGKVVRMSKLGKKVKMQVNELAATVTRSMADAHQGAVTYTHAEDPLTNTLSSERR